ncbi:MAG: SHOCT domain-containing protein [Bacteroidota bacterium]
MNTKEDIHASKDSKTIAYLLCILIALFAYFIDMSAILAIVLVMSSILSLIAGYAGEQRKIGFATAFFVSLFLSPLIGLILIAISPRIQDEEYKQKMMEIAENNIRTSSVADELQKLSELRKEGILSDEEFAAQKERILAG